MMPTYNAQIVDDARSLREIIKDARRPTYNYASYIYPEEEPKRYDSVIKRLIFSFLVCIV
jgi:hypothetical protein